MIGALLPIAISGAELPSAILGAELSIVILRHPAIVGAIGTTEL